MTQPISEEDPVRVVRIGDPYRDELLIRAKPEERITRGMRPEDFFGICAEEFDDEYMEAVLAIRRGVWPRQRRS